MASLALMATLVIACLWGLGTAALLLSFLGFRVLGAVFGALSILSGAWLLLVLPHVPLLGAGNMVAGWVAVSRCFNDKQKEEK